MSWVAHLFNPAQATRTSFAPSNDPQPPVFSNVQNDQDKDGSNSKYRERPAGEYTQSMEEEEEEYPRHPYWQVSQLCIP